MACLDCPICNISMELPLWDDKPVSGGPAPHDLLCGSPVSDTVSPRVPGEGDSLVKFHLVHASGEDEGRESDSIFDEDHSGFAYGHKENAVDSSVNSAHSEESGFCSSETTLNLQCAESALWWTGETSVDPDEIAVTPPLVPHTHQSTKRQSFTGFEEYNFDVYCHRKEVEKRSHFTDCLKNQVEITPGIRGVLVSWLSKVHKEFQLSLDTLFLTVNIVDRLLKVKPVSRECFQLVGATAMLIAGKHEEVTPPEIQDLLWVCGDTYTREQMKELEKIMLEAIHFDLFVPTASFFLEYYAFCEISTVDDINRLRNARRQGKYFLELSLQDYELCQYPPSMLALCAWKAAVRDCAHEYNLYPEWESDFPPGGAFDECYQEFTMFMTRLTHCFPEANVLSEVNAYEDVDDSESE